MLKAIVCAVICGLTLRVVSEEEIIRLENSVVRLDIEQLGGNYVNLQLKSNPVNPLSWRKTPETMPKGAHSNAVYKGHFLCMGRIGKPSPGELAAGVPMRGEQTGRLWTVNHREPDRVEMECEAPLDGLKVQRTVELHADAPQFTVKEKFTNTGSLGRVHNVLQHVTIAAPFLSASTRVNSNAKQGFSHKFGYPDPHRLEYRFPFAKLDETGVATVDLRAVSGSNNWLSKHIFDGADPYGWVTAYDPESGLLLGYIWKTADYPWIQFWNGVKDGKPVALGLEFGTAGVAGTYKELLETDTRFHGVRSWEYIDAGETIEKNFASFIMQLDKQMVSPVVAVEGEEVVLDGTIRIPIRLD